MENLIGQPIDRVDGRLKVTGRATYAYEHSVPHAAYAAMVMSTVAKGRITSMDTKAAEKSAGVLVVMTHVNTPKMPASMSQKPVRPSPVLWCRRFRTTWSAMQTSR